MCATRGPVVTDFLTDTTRPIPCSSTLSLVEQLNITFVFTVFVFKPLTLIPAFQLTLQSSHAVLGCPVQRTSLAIRIDAAEKQLKEGNK